MTEAMGIWRFTLVSRDRWLRAFSCRDTTKGNAGAKTCEMHVSQPMSHRRVLCSRAFLSKSILKELQWYSHFITIRFIEFNTQLFYKFYNF